MALIDDILRTEDGKDNPRGNAALQAFVTALEPSRHRPDARALYRHIRAVCGDLQNRGIRSDEGTVCQALLTAATAARVDRRDATIEPWALVKRIMAAEGLKIANPAAWEGLGKCAALASNEQLRFRWYGAAFVALARAAADKHYDTQPLLWFGADNVQAALGWRNDEPSPELEANAPIAIDLGSKIVQDRKLFAQFSDLCTKGALLTADYSKGRALNAAVAGEFVNLLGELCWELRPGDDPQKISSVLCALAGEPELDFFRRASKRQIEEVIRNRAIHDPARVSAYAESLVSAMHGYSDDWSLIEVAIAQAAQGNSALRAAIRTRISQLSNLIAPGTVQNTQLEAAILRAAAPGIMDAQWKEASPGEGSSSSGSPTQRVLINALANDAERDHCTRIRALLNGQNAPDQRDAAIKSLIYVANASLTTIQQAVEAVTGAPVEPAVLEELNAEVAQRLELQPLDVKPDELSGEQFEQVFQYLSGHQTLTFDQVFSHYNEEKRRNLSASFNEHLIKKAVHQALLDDKYNDDKYNFTIFCLAREHFTKSPPACASAFYRGLDWLTGLVNKLIKGRQDPLITIEESARVIGLEPQEYDRLCEARSSKDTSKPARIIERLDDNAAQRRRFTEFVLKLRPTLTFFELVYEVNEGLYKIARGDVAGSSIREMVEAVGAASQSNLLQFFWPKASLHAIKAALEEAKRSPAQDASHTRPLTENKSNVPRYRRVDLDPIPANISRYRHVVTSEQRAYALIKDLEPIPSDDIAHFFNATEINAHTRRDLRVVGRAWRDGKNYVVVRVPGKNSAQPFYEAYEARMLLRSPGYGVDVRPVAYEERVELIPMAFKQRVTANKYRVRNRTALARHPDAEAEASPESSTRLSDKELSDEEIEKYLEEYVNEGTDTLAEKIIDAVVSGHPTNTFKLYNACRAFMCTETGLKGSDSRVDTHTEEFIFNALFYRLGGRIDFQKRRITELPKTPNSRIKVCMEQFVNRALAIGIAREANLDNNFWLQQLTHKDTQAIVRKAESSTKARRVFEILSRQEQSSRAKRMLALLPTHDADGTDYIHQDMAYSRREHLWFEVPVLAQNRDKGTVHSPAFHQYGLANGNLKAFIIGRTQLGDVVLEVHPSGQNSYKIAIPPSQLDVQKFYTGVEIDQLGSEKDSPVAIPVEFKKVPDGPGYFLYTPTYDKGLELQALPYNRRLRGNDLLVHLDKFDKRVDGVIPEYYPWTGLRERIGRKQTFYKYGLMEVARKIQRDGKDFIVLEVLEGHDRGTRIAVDARYAYAEILRTCESDPAKQAVREGEKVSFMPDPGNHSILIRHRLADGTATSFERAMSQVVPLVRSGAYARKAILEGDAATVCALYRAFRIPIMGGHLPDISPEVDFNLNAKPVVRDSIVANMVKSWTDISQEEAERLALQVVDRAQAQLLKQWVLANEARGHDGLSLAPFTPAKQKEFKEAILGRADERHRLRRPFGLGQRKELALYHRLQNALVAQESAANTFAHIRDLQPKPEPTMADTPPEGWGTIVGRCGDYKVIFAFKGLNGEKVEWAEDVRSLLRSSVFSNAPFGKIEQNAKVRFEHRGKQRFISGWKDAQTQQIYYRDTRADEILKLLQPHDERTAPIREYYEWSDLEHRVGIRKNLHKYGRLDVVGTAQRNGKRFIVLAVDNGGEHIAVDVEYALAELLRTRKINPEAQAFKPGECVSFIPTSEMRSLLLRHGKEDAVVPEAGGSGTRESHRVLIDQVGDAYGKIYLKLTAKASAKKAAAIIAGGDALKTRALYLNFRHQFERKNPGISMAVGDKMANFIAQHWNTEENVPLKQAQQLAHEVVDRAEALAILRKVISPADLLKYGLSSLVPLTPEKRQLFKNELRADTALGIRKSYRRLLSALVRQEIAARTFSYIGHLAEIPEPKNDGLAPHGWSQVIGRAGYKIVFEFKGPGNTTKQWSEDFATLVQGHLFSNAPLNLVDGQVQAGAWVRFENEGREHVVAGWESPEEHAERQARSRSAETVLDSSPSGSGSKSAERNFSSTPSPQRRSLSLNTALSP